MLHLISLALLISCEPPEWRQRGLPLSRDVNLQPFQFHPGLSKPFRLDDLTSWTKVPFAFHFLRDKDGEGEKKEKVLYIVMLPHLSDISKIEVRAKDRYKLKVNTKRRRGRRDTLPCWGEIHFLVWLSCFVCSRGWQRKGWGEKWKVKKSWGKL